MPTTSPEVALRALQGLREVGVEYAVLHAAHKLHEGDVSDVDVAMTSDPQNAIAVATNAWTRLGLRPVLAWPYDIGGTLTLFLASNDGKEGVQLDILFDRDGIGKYGLRSDALVASAVPESVPVVSEPARLIYLWKKRTVKGDQRALDALRSEARTIPAQDLLQASMDLTGSLETANNILGKGSARPEPRRHPVARFRRVVGRIVDPIGYWAHVEDRAIAEELATRLSGYLVMTHTGPVPARLVQPWWHATQVWPTILRPGAYLSHGTRPTWSPSPSLVLTAETADENASQLIEAMSARMSQ